MLRILSNWLQILAHLLNPSSPLGLGLERFTPDRIGKHRLNEPLFSDSRSVTYSLRSSQTNGLKTLLGSWLNNEFSHKYDALRKPLRSRTAAPGCLPNTEYTIALFRRDIRVSTSWGITYERVKWNYQRACKMGLWMFELQWTANVQLAADPSAHALGPKPVGNRLVIDCNLQGASLACFSFYRCND